MINLQQQQYKRRSWKQKWRIGSTMHLGLAGFDARAWSSLDRSRSSLNCACTLNTAIPAHCWLWSCPYPHVVIWRVWFGTPHASMQMHRSRKPTNTNTHSTDQKLIMKIQCNGGIFSFSYSIRIACRQACCCWWWWCNFAECALPPTSQCLHIIYIYIYTEIMIYWLYDAEIFTHFFGSIANQSAKLL